MLKAFTFPILLMFMLVCGLAFVGGARLELADATTPVNGIIAADTTWTKTNSPYNLTGPIAVNQGVTLTIEAGTTVNLNDYYIQVNGTLIAGGTETNRIQFSYGLIKFMPSSASWDAQTGSGSIIEYVNGGLVDINGVSPKISHCTLHTISVYQGSPLISNCILNKIYVSVGTPTITNNIISSGMTLSNGAPTVGNNQITGSITISGTPILSGNIIATPSNASAIINNGGSPIIDNNIIKGGGFADYSPFGFQSYSTIQINGGNPTITNNKISLDLSDPNSENTSIAVSVVGQFTLFSNNIVNGDVNIKKGQATITCNLVYGTIEAGDASIINNTITWSSYYGIFVNGESIITHNRLYFDGTAKGVGIYLAGDVTVENNYITGGISTGLGNFIVRNNTIAAITTGADAGSLAGKIASTGGIYGSISGSSIIAFNNLEGGIYLTSADNVNASYNWWGTTDTQAINNTIHDFKNDFNLGTVNFVPFLIEPNPQAMPDPNLPTPPSSPTPASSSQPDAGVSIIFGLGWTGIAIIALLSILAVAVAVTIAGVFLHKRRAKQDP